MLTCNYVLRPSCLLLDSYEEFDLMAQSKAVPWVVALTKVSPRNAYGRA